MYLVLSRPVLVGRAWIPCLQHLPQAAAYRKSFFNRKPVWLGSIAPTFDPYSQSPCRQDGSLLIDRELLRIKSAQTDLRRWRPSFVTTVGRIQGVKTHPYKTSMAAANCSLETVQHLTSYHVRNLRIYGCSPFLH